MTPDLGLWELNGLTAEAFKQGDVREGLVTFGVVMVPHGRRSRTP